MVPLKYFILSRIYYRPGFCKGQSISFAEFFDQGPQGLAGFSVSGDGRELHDFMRS